MSGRGRPGRHRAPALPRDDVALWQSPTFVGLPWHSGQQLDRGPIAEQAIPHTKVHCTTFRAPRARPHCGPDEGRNASLKVGYSSVEPTLRPRPGSLRHILPRPSRTTPLLPPRGTVPHPLARAGPHGGTPRPSGDFRRASREDCQLRAGRSRPTPRRAPRPFGGSRPAAPASREPMTHTVLILMNAPMTVTAPPARAGQ